MTNTYTLGDSNPDGPDAVFGEVIPDLCETCPEDNAHVAVTFLGDKLVCGTCFVQRYPEPPMGTSAVTGEPCC